MLVILLNTVMEGVQILRDDGNIRTFNVIGSGVHNSVGATLPSFSTEPMYQVGGRHCCSAGSVSFQVLTTN